MVICGKEATKPGSSSSVLPSPSGFWKTGAPLEILKDPCWTTAVGLRQDWASYITEQSVICHTVSLGKDGGLRPHEDRHLPHVMELAPCLSLRGETQAQQFWSWANRLISTSPVSSGNSQCPWQILLQCWSKGLVPCSCLLLASGGPLLQQQLW